MGEFALRGDELNISRYIPPTDPASEPFVLPTAALKALMFRGSVELERATLDDIDMKGVTLRLLLDEKGLHSDAQTARGLAMKAHAKASHRGCSAGMRNPGGTICPGNAIFSQRAAPIAYGSRRSCCSRRR